MWAVFPQGQTPPLCVSPLNLFRDRLTRDMYPRRLYLCGGGIRTFAHLGALHVFEEKGYLQFVKEWMGISAGAFLALCLALRFPLAELREFFLKFDLTTVMDADTAPGWLYHLGYDTGNKLQKLAEAFLHQKGLPSNTTFADLEAKGFLAFRTFATDIQTGTLVEFSTAKTPTYCVAQAVRASMSLPYYFQPFPCPVTGHLLCDGGVLSNYPLRFLSEKDLDETLGIQFLTRTPPVDDDDLIGILMRPLRILMHEHHTLESKDYEKQTLTVHLDNVNLMDLNISIEGKLAIVEKGREAAHRFVQTGKKPVRRYSVG